MDKETFLDIVSSYDREDFRKSLYQNGAKYKLVDVIEVRDKDGNIIPPTPPEVFFSSK